MLDHAISFAAVNASQRDRVARETDTEAIWRRFISLDVLETQQFVMAQLYACGDGHQALAAKRLMRAAGIRVCGAAHRLLRGRRAQFELFWCHWHDKRHGGEPAWAESAAAT